MNLKETQLFYSVIKLTKPFAVLMACTGDKGIGIIVSRADNYTVATRCCFTSIILNYQNMCDI